MEYKHMDTMEDQPSLLGFGCMRFPTLEDGSIDEVEAEKMIDTAMAAGVNYIDTAYPYHDGNSEPFVGRVLKKYKRDQFYLATKLPIWELESKEDVKRIFDEQLQRLQVDYVDFYLLHALDAKKWETVLSFEIIPFLEQMKEEGKIRHIGFSFHDDYEVFEKIILYRDWDFCQIQLNYMDTHIQAGLKGYQLADKLGIPMVIMEPIKGGRLVNLPDDIKTMFIDEDPSKSIASWALRWVASLPNVKVVLSGMSTMKQVLDNLKTFDQFIPLNESELKTVRKVADTIRSRVKNGCTGCGYCMPCPFGIDIPKNFKIWNTEAMYGDFSAANDTYEEMKEAAACHCKQCGKCETLCPQQIAIREDLEKVAKHFAQ